jgi:hypothetical protein
LSEAGGEVNECSNFAGKISPGYFNLSGLIPRPLGRGALFFKVCNQIGKGR